MKQFSTFLNGVLASAVVFLVFFSVLPNARAGATAAPTETPAPASAPAESCDSNRTISVSGTAVVNVTPDRALIELGVQSNGRSPKEVQARNAAAISKVIRAIKALDVEAKDITTEHYIIQPIY